MHTTRTNICTTNCTWCGWVRRRTACRVRRHENLVREPDAGNPPVRFDEREVETEQGGILWPRQPKGPATRMAHLNRRATSRLYCVFPWLGLWATPTLTARLFTPFFSLFD
jgi:hypothetical protein